MCFGDFLEVEYFSDCFSAPALHLNLLQMAKAVANATTAAFITMVGSEFVQKYLGEGPRMVRDVFRLARENSPAIVFIDEIGTFFCMRVCG